MKKKIVFTGGGSGGHVMPAITLIKKLKELDYSIEYIGGRESIERTLISSKNISYNPIFTGKLRRYFSVQNFIDLFKVGVGFLQSLFILIKMSKKTLVFSTGGFVSVPVVLAAKILGKKIFIHEQTTRVGLANKISSKFADKVFVSFEDSLKFFPTDKVELSGYPLRDECYTSDIDSVVINNLNLNDLSKPIMFITGGGNGSLLLNELIKKNLDWLKEEYFIVHQVGKKFVDEYSAFNDSNYMALDFVGPEIIDLFKMSKVVISRAGAGTVCELMALKKKSILVPLKIAQKNEQYHNAMALNKACGSLVIEEDTLKNASLKELINELGSETKVIDTAMPNGAKFLIDEIQSSFT